MRRRGPVASPSVFDRELAFAHEPADRAAEIGFGSSAASFEVHAKPDAVPGDPGRPRDRGDGARTHRRRASPTTRPRRGAGRRRRARTATWILDPIDATKNFARGIPIWATLLALQVDGRSERRLVSAPALGERYAAVRGEGASCNGEPIHVCQVDRHRRGARPVLGHEGLRAGPPGNEAVLSRHRGGATRSRAFGDFWGHVLVARGAAELMMEPELNVWDYAAPQLVAEEAGGRMTTMAGGPTVTAAAC